MDDVYFLDSNSKAFTRLFIISQNQVRYSLPVLNFQQAKSQEKVEYHRPNSPCNSSSKPSCLSPLPYQRHARTRQPCTQPTTVLAATDWRVWTTSGVAVPATHLMAHPVWIWHTVVLETSLQGLATRRPTVLECTRISALRMASLTVAPMTTLDRTGSRATFIMAVRWCQRWLEGIECSRPMYGVLFRRVWRVLARPVLDIKRYI